MNSEASAPAPPDNALDVAVIGRLAAKIDERLGQQISFILELDRLKGIIRRSRLIDSSRFENTAEHSWHLAMMAIVLGERAAPEVDVARALKLVLVHDIVEIDAGDVYIYDDAARLSKQANEEAAADRLFGLLPDDQAAEMRELWDEYEDRATPTGQFAYAIDRLQPLLLNAGSGGLSWTENGIREAQVQKVNGPIVAGAVELWDLAQAIIAEATAAGLLLPEE